MRTAATERKNLYMERVLEQTCRLLPYGGDHDLRAFIARRISDAAFAGNDTLGELGIVARKALADYEKTPQRPIELKSSSSFVLDGYHEAAE